VPHAACGILTPCSSTLSCRCSCSCSGGSKCRCSSFVVVVAVADTVAVTTIRKTIIHATFIWSTDSKIAYRVCCNPIKIKINRPRKGA
jgi:hypothetical protein